MLEDVYLLRTVLADALARLDATDEHHLHVLTPNEYPLTEYVARHACTGRASPSVSLPPVRSVQLSGGRVRVDASANSVLLSVRFECPEWLGEWLRDMHNARAAVAAEHPRNEWQRVLRRCTDRAFHVQFLITSRALRRVRAQRGEPRTADAAAREMVSWLMDTVTELQRRLTLAQSEVQRDAWRAVHQLTL
ncbi:hypothetical protein CDCA_CDCA07G2235 [Cyanidium caldarium]|uniref:Uncharacterized protein n=1 Tax=Cyanidium caldarium TaxID=2771 RepID=A0AAV9IV73_CYACA|nr:hypothetical protein CDCA_CDCA07G2235 [Cyanidium caldarium]